ncbi:MAG: alpha-amylase family glycosyl hydrolase [Candidatus Krumholzibacteriia bacterium]
MIRPYSDGSEHYCSVERRGKGRRLRAAFRVPAGASLRAAWLRSHPDGEAEYRQMRRVAHGAWEIWEATIALRGDRHPYRFVLEDQAGRLWHHDQRGLHAVPPGDDADFTYLEQPPPGWLAGRTFYQILPDRFARQDGPTTPAQRARQAGLPLAEPTHALGWGEPMPGYRQGGGHAFMGGNLAGLRERLPYLTDLGVGGLSLNPIFLAGTYHRYDTWDYHAVDPRLGTAQELAALSRDLHESDLRLILDGVFNHVGSGHRWFNRPGHFPEAGAWQDRGSPFAEFFFFRRHPDRYECWCGIKELVKLDYRSRRLREEIYGGHQSVVRRWLRPPYAIDGWRLDVANMLGRCGRVQLGPEVLRELRAAVKETSPDAYLLGENFFDATAQLQGDQLDGVQTYQGFHFPVLRWLTGRELQVPRGLRRQPPAHAAALGAEGLAAALLEHRARLPFAIAQAGFNQLSSHDTPRIATQLEHDPLRQRLAVALLLLWPGVPCVYYGDEVGLDGGADPDNRQGMPWDPATWDDGLRGWYRSLIARRRRDPVLADGGVEVLHASGDTFAFARILGDRLRLAVLHRGQEPATVTLDLTQVAPLATFAGDLLDDRAELPVRDGRLVVALPPGAVRLLQPEGSA